MSYSQEADLSQRIKAFEDKTSDSKTKIERSKNKATATVQTEHGKIQVTCEVENVDFASQCHAEWEKIKENKDSKKTSKDKRDSHSPAAKVKISWSRDQ